MPTYDYECDACGHTFDKFQSILSAPIRKCPKCGKAKVRRLIGAGAGIIFKGSGFYQTDYRSDSYRKAAQADHPASDAAKGSAPAKGDEGGKAPKSADKPSAPPKKASGE